MGKQSVYEMVTDRIIAELKTGRIPWEKPWTGGYSAWSRSTGKPYSFINQLMLPAGEYATYKQVQESGGNVKKGAKGYMVVFWKMIINSEKDEKGEEKISKFPMLRYYTVFNVETQCEGITKKYNYDEIESVIGNPIEECERVLADYISRSGVHYNTVKSGSAYYAPLIDSINMPLFEQFRTVEEYYSTAFHECAHSTGHSTRLARDGVTALAGFGSEKYSKEELIAELTASGILASLGVETAKTFRNTAGYIQSWIKALQDDVRMIVYASSKADKALAMILGVEVESEAEQ